MKAKTYDIVLSSPFSNYDFFAHRLRQYCGQMGLTFFLVDDVWVHEFAQKLKEKEIGVRVLFDLSANQLNEDDAYVQLAREVIKQRGTVIDDPDITIATAHKGIFHNVLLENKIPVPETIIVNRSELENFTITREIRAKIGVPFVIKPAWGDSGVGVNIDGHYEEDLLKSAEEAPNSDAFLIQTFVEPIKLGNHVGWFRMFYICGEVIPCWWDPRSHEYHLVSPQQVKRYKLAPLARVMRGIARVSRMRKFTSEICLHTDGKFYAVDYINADPDMNPRSFYDNGVPDELVRYIVWLLFDEAMQIVKKGHGFFDRELYESEADADWLEKRKLEQRAVSR
jgi:hypothetical protein